MEGISFVYFLQIYLNPDIAKKSRLTRNMYFFVFSSGLGHNRVKNTKS